MTKIDERPRRKRRGFVVNVVGGLATCAAVGLVVGFAGWDLAQAAARRVSFWGESVTVADLLAADPGEEVRHS